MRDVADEQETRFCFKVQHIKAQLVHVNHTSGYCS